jgi:sulfate adenylyltransferase subunit 2
MLTHLQRLEAESIQIMREVVAECEHPVMLYSIGKDSAVMLHLAVKAFYPSKLPFPLLHVDTTWKFREMIEFRDVMVKKLGLDLIVHINPEGVAKGINPFTHGSAVHTDIWKTEGLKQALDKYGFDVAFGGARRDEEKARAKERVFSVRNEFGEWDPKRQRPELWSIYNGKIHPGENVRVFPISNWTELDVWHYIQRENIALPSLYFAHEREVVRRNGSWMAAEPCLNLDAQDKIVSKLIRFRTIGDITCTAAVESGASTVEDIVQELRDARFSERGARLDDLVSEAAMEDRKKAGYF